MVPSESEMVRADDRVSLRKKPPSFVRIPIWMMLRWVLPLSRACMIVHVKVRLVTGGRTKVVPREADSRPLGN